MRFLWVTFFVLSLTLLKGQYFHESLDLYSNLRSHLVYDQKCKIGFKTYSNLKFQNTVPNLLDNFYLNSRFKFKKKDHWMLRNTEFGVGIQAFISGANQFPELYEKPPMLIKIYDTGGKNLVISPGVQIIRNLWINDSTSGRLQVGLGLRYNYIGNDQFFSKSYPFGFDLTLYFRNKLFSVQYLYSAFSIYNSFTFKIEDIDETVESDKDRVSIPDEFRNLSFLTFGFGDDYNKKPTKDEKTLYNFYFTFRRDDYSNKELRNSFSTKYMDYIFGFWINHLGLKINPEFSITPQYKFDGYSYKCHNISLLMGYVFKHFEISAGYSHLIFYPLAVDVYSLQDAEDIHCDRLSLSLAYGF